MMLDRARQPRRRRRGGRRGFSLVEVLLAIFILGIGVISIAALFPAGIAQQRLSADDMMGPVVARNAMELIRSKVRDVDFSYAFTEPGHAIEGDFNWRRPAFFMADTSVTGPLGSHVVPAGSISIFDDGLPNTTDSELVDQYNADLYGGEPPDIILTQGERSYPMYTVDPATGFVPSGEPPRPQYVWDCMFRRFQGRMWVAVFVYRVSDPGGERSAYAVAPNISNASVPPLPVAVDLESHTYYDAFDVGEGNLSIDPPDPLLGTPAGTAYNPANQDEAWQEPRQWLLDHHNNIHRVVSNYREDDNATAVQMELVRPIPYVMPLSVYAFPGSAADVNGDGIPDDNVISTIWYIPVSDGAGRTLTPVYLMVAEL